VIGLATHRFRVRRDGGVIAGQTHLVTELLEVFVIRAPGDDPGEHADDAQAMHLVTRLNATPQDTDDGDVLRSEDVRGDRARGSGPNVREKSVVKQDGGRHPGRRVEHGHQTRSARQTFRRIAVEPARDLDRDVGRPFDECRLDVKFPARRRDLEVDHRRHVRPSLAIRPKGLSHRLDGVFRSNGLTQRGFFDRAHFWTPGNENW
jgi:hypothetical protein